MQEKKIDSNQCEIRRERHLRRLGTRTPRCMHCGETDPTALTGGAPTLVCYECQAEATGHTTLEKHHVAGRHNDPMTVTLPGNDHRILSDLQRDWPLETLRNPTGSPLRQAAATLRGWLDVLILLIERVVGWIPPFLEWLDDQLLVCIGEQWWVTLGWQGARP